MRSFSIFAHLKLSLDAVFGRDAATEDPLGRVLALLQVDYDPRLHPAPLHPLHLNVEKLRQRLELGNPVYEGNMTQVNSGFWTII